ncbi:MAG TPA: 1-deoxy-D-xylulose-5-phosphate reductoisomerase [Actinomycetota bacterium]|nr:1-deoxy-D-xylulose-5-phosphate reductoisomerase [Actinomycetota bacterium]
MAVLGSTGSIGTQALDVIRSMPQRFRVRSLAVRSDVEQLAAQVLEFCPRRVAVVDASAAASLREQMPDTEVLEGPEALLALASDDEADVVLNAVVGAAGLEATLAALDAGRTVALANKESCVAGGPLVRARLDAGRGSVVPVDSEHAAVHMCLEGEAPDGVRRLVLTASGGPFRGMKREQLRDAGVSQALDHPTWSMGAKVTVDSATLMNKGLEVIEAHVLFGFGYDDIDVVCHPQSVVHCLVEFVDGSWKASLGPPDMRVPIAYALGHPRRPDWGAGTMDWAGADPLTFEPVDRETFGCLDLACEAGRAGGTAPAILNAANEEAVSAFLDGRLRFLQIEDVVRQVARDGAARTAPGDTALQLEDVLSADKWARAAARQAISASGDAG